MEALQRYDVTGDALRAMNQASEACLRVGSDCQNGLRGSRE